MAKIEQVLAPHENVNDESMTVIEWCVEDGQFVEADAVLLIVENSKATFEICAPVSGYVRRLVEADNDVPVGDPLCLIAGNIEDLPQPKAFSLPESERLRERAKTTNNQRAKADQSDESISSSDPVEIHKIAIPAGEIKEPSVTVLEFLVQDESKIDADASILKIETASGQVSISSPDAGFVKFLVNPKAEVSVDVPICLVGTDLPRLRSLGAKFGATAIAPTESKQIAVAPHATDSSRFKHYKSVRFSEKALEFIHQNDISPEIFANHGLVRSIDVLEHLGRGSAVSVRSTTAPQIDTGIPQPHMPSTDPSDANIPSGEMRNLVLGVPSREKRLSRAKRTEIRYLAAAKAAVIPSMVSILVPTRGIFSLCRGSSKYAGQFSVRIIFETARLLRKYPMFNAGYRDGNIVYYDDINIGFAMDIGQGLRVPVIKNADQKDLSTIADEKVDFIGQYLDSSLSVEALSGGTFTITDLSDENGWEFIPIINRGQSAILGVGSEEMFSETRGYYPLILTFDHRLSEGLTATRFLTDLKQRLMAHENVLLSEMGIASLETLSGQYVSPHLASDKTPKQLESEYKTDDLYCQQCIRSISELHEVGMHLMKSIDKQGKECLICTICFHGL